MPLPLLPPAYAANLPLTALHTSELLVLVSLRLWVAPHRSPSGSHPHWCGGFAAAGMDRHDIAAFDRVLRILVTTAQRRLDIRYRRCRYLGADEARLLQLVNLLQEGQRQEAMMLLSGWIPPAALRLALPPAQRFATALTEGGLPLPPRLAAADRQNCNPMHRDRGLALVH
jgi:hypothetical protein